MPMPKVDASRIPSCDEKIGKKIDFIVSRIHENLTKKNNYEKIARDLVCKTYRNDHEIAYLINFQGNRRNEGASGSFCINVGIAFKEIKKILIEIPTYSYLASVVDNPKELMCEIATRIHRTIPSEKETWWPQPLVHNKDTWFEINENTDLLELSNGLHIVIERYVLPWFAEKGNYEYLVESKRNYELSTASYPHRIAAAILLDQKKIALDIINSHADHKNTILWDETMQWVRKYGMDPL